MFPPLVAFAYSSLPQGCGSGYPHRTSDDAPELARAQRLGNNHRTFPIREPPLTRRSTPQKRIDDDAFPVRVKVLVPECGFDRRMPEMYAWLDREVGRGDYALHGGSTVGLARNVAAFYFRAAEPAHRFVAAFPEHGAG